MKVTERSWTDQFLRVITPVMKPRYMRLCNRAAKYQFIALNTHGITGENGYQQDMNGLYE